MDIKFEAVLSPRTEDGGFGPISCGKCKAKTTGYLKIILFRTSHIIICPGCLSEGIEMVHNTMRESYIIADKDN